MGLLRVLANVGERSADTDLDEFSLPPRTPATGGKNRETPPCLSKRGHGEGGGREGGDADASGGTCGAVSGSSEAGRAAPHGADVRESPGRRRNPTHSGRPAARPGRRTGRGVPGSEPAAPATRRTVASGAGTSRRVSAGSVAIFGRIAHNAERGVALAETWLPQDVSVRFVPILAHGEKIHPNDPKGLSRPLTLRGQRRKVERIKCGEPLVKALRA